MSTLPASDREHLRVTVYTPESGLRSPGRFLREMWRDICSANCRDLAWRLLVRNISATYRQSLGGMFWLFINPIFSAAVWIFLNSQKVINIETPGLPYPVFVMTGNFAWAGFVSGLTQPIDAVNRERALLTKLSFPREALLMAGFGELALNSLVPFITLIPIFIYFGIVPGVTVFFFPLIVLGFMLFGFTLGVLVTPVGLFFRDIYRGMPLVAKVWFFLTPIVYPIPESGWLHTIAKYNPATPFIVTTREVLVGQTPTMIVPLMIVFAGVLIFAFIGLLMYRLSMPHVVERMSA